MHKVLPSYAIQLLGAAEHIPDVTIFRPLNVRLADCLVQSISVKVQLARSKLENLVEWPGELGSLRRHGNAHIFVKPGSFCKPNKMVSQKLELL